MAHTYRPFADLSALSEISRDLSMNVSDGERLASIAAGVALAGFGTYERGLPGLALIALAGGLIFRGASGHCHLYSWLERDSRHVFAGVKSGQGVRVEDTVDIRCAPDGLYDFWHELETLPFVCGNLVSVEKLGPRRSKWTVEGPGGVELAWRAEIVNDKQNRLIAWKSLPGAQIPNAGTVRFEPTPTGTQVRVVFEYQPPAGAVGDFVAGLFGASPKTWLHRDLETLRDFAEKELGQAKR